MKTIPVIHAAGTPFQCGETVGRALRDAIKANIPDYLDIFHHVAGAGRDDVYAYARKLPPAIQAYAPKLIDEMQGLAAGAGVTFEDILVLNARTEIMAGIMAGRKGGGPDECTSIATLPEVTANGHTLMGQNWDWIVTVASRTALIRLEQEGHPRALVFTEAGIVGKIGCNEHGIGVCANRLTSSHDKGEIGVPWHIQLRKAMAAPNMHRAIQAVVQPKRGASGMFMIGAKGGEAIVLETTPTDFGSLLPEDGILTHSNHYLCPELKAVDTRKSGSALTLIRHARARRLMARESGAITLESYKRVLRDHFSYPQAICRHADESDPLADRTLSAASILMDLDSGEMQIAAGPPCENDYQSLSVLGNVAGATKVKAQAPK